jgi:DNA-directed RNA polymerase specialized sigma subunit
MDVLAEVKALADPVARFEAAGKEQQRLSTLLAELSTVKSEVIGELIVGRSFREVGDLLGISGSRVSQLSQRGAA